MPKGAWLSKPQEHLGPIGLIILLVAGSLACPISLDMYTPAIPQMTTFFDTDATTVNATLFGYFLFFTISMLIFGPLSDKFGRKPILLLGTVMFTIAGALCAISTTIEMLITARAIQALGGGAMNAVVNAIVKDTFLPEKRELALSAIQVMFLLGPVIAPLAGAFILMGSNWRMIFWVLSGFGLLCLALVLLFQETLPIKERYVGTLAGSIGQLAVVAKNRGFTIFLTVTALFSLPFMAYIAAASHIYITFFGLSEIEYSLYFSSAALFTAAGPFIWLLASRFVSARRFTTIMLILAVLSGVAMLVVGQSTPWFFCLTILIFIMIESCIRPYTTNILLSQHQDEAGATSSLINVFHNVACTLGMALAVLPWSNYIIGIGVLIIVSIIIAILTWIMLLRSHIPLFGIKGEDPVGIWRD
ncbi:MAG: multidrug effflux MFS transporter [Coriobacteriaceae bacterium]|nr:multidrug effflux MFS transporter [Coriobacteriaceae bacterium]